MKMKKLILPLRLLLIAVLIAAVALTIASCGNGTGTGTQKATEAATETGTGTGEAETEVQLEPEEVEVGEGAKTVTVNVINKQDKGSEVWYKVIIKTDAKTLADALTENGIAEGSESEYGLYITKLIVPLEGGNYEKEAEDGYWWCLEQNGEMTTEGASFIEISGGEEFDFTYLTY
ncbi:MAG: DUF4430 domain-containing protein [Clostridia bacterium]|nr:DUF4430 domain-containing protein [Clostridia bacterium]MBR3639775.1 DUF4430 domain-containing protein [Clostridia bacterium]